MSQFITAFIEDDDSLGKEIEELTKDLPEALQTKIESALQTYQDADFDTCEKLCQEILAKKSNLLPIQFTLASSSLMLEQLDEAEVILKELLKSNYRTNHVHLYLSYICLNKQYFKQALKHIKKVGASKKYIPYYYSTYGGILDSLGQYKKSREMFEKEINHYRTTHIIPSSEMLDGAFQNILYLDIILHHRAYQQELDTYYEFLERIEMTEAMQLYLTQNIVFFSHLQS